MYPGFVSAPLDSAGDAARESSIQGAIDAAWWENPPGLRSGLNLNFDGSPAYLIRNQHIVAGDSGAWHKYLWFAYVWLKRWPEEDDLPELFFIPSDVVAQAMQRCKKLLPQYKLELKLI